MEQTLETLRDAILAKDKDLIQEHLNNEELDFIEKVSNPSGPGSSSLISFAVQTQDISILSIITEKVKLYDHSGLYNQQIRNALVEAQRAGYENVIEFLFSIGAEPTEYLLYKEAAKDSPNFNIIESFISHGASVELAITLASGNFEPKDKYQQVCEILFDYARGANLDISSFNNLNLEGICLLGTSISGIPITLPMLQKSYFNNPEKALYTLNDILQLTDENRKSRLLGRIHKAVQQQGEIISDEGIYNLVPLSLLAEQGQYAAVNVRIQAGCNPNDSKRVGGKSAILLAFENGHYEIVKVLAQHPNIDKKTLAEIIELSRKKNPTLANYLIQQNPYYVDENGNTLLHLAVMDRNLDKTEILLNEGAEVHQPNNAGRTPLSLAAEDLFSCSAMSDAPQAAIVVEIIKLLLTKKPIIIKPDRSTPIGYAVRAQNKNAVQFLMQFVNKEVREDWYNVLLFYALEEAGGAKNIIEVLKILKEEGVNFSIQNHWKESLLHRTISRICAYTSTNSQYSGINFLLAMILTSL